MRHLSGGVVFEGVHTAVYGVVLVDEFNYSLCAQKVYLCPYVDWLWVKTLI